MTLKDLTSSMKQLILRNFKEFLSQLSAEKFFEKKGFLSNEKQIFNKVIEKNKYEINDEFEKNLAYELYNKTFKTDLQTSSLLQIFIKNLKTNPGLMPETILGDKILNYCDRLNREIEKKKISELISLRYSDAENFKFRELLRENRLLLIKAKDGAFSEILNIGDFDKLKNQENFAQITLFFAFGRKNDENSLLKLSVSDLLGFVHYRDLAEIKDILEERGYLIRNLQILDHEENQILFEANDSKGETVQIKINFLQNKEDASVNFNADITTKTTIFSLKGLEELRKKVESDKIVRGSFDLNLAKRNEIDAYRSETVSEQLNLPHIENFSKEIENLNKIFRELQKKTIIPSKIEQSKYALRSSEKKEIRTQAGVKEKAATSAVKKQVSSEEEAPRKEEKEEKTEETQKKEKKESPFYKILAGIGLGFFGESIDPTGFLNSINPFNLF